MDDDALLKIRMDDASKHRAAIAAAREIERFLKDNINTKAGITYDVLVERALNDYFVVVIRLFYGEHGYFNQIAPEQLTSDNSGQFLKYTIERYVYELSKKIFLKQDE